MVDAMAHTILLHLSPQILTSFIANPYTKKTTLNLSLSRLVAEYGIVLESIGGNVFHFFFNKNYRFYQGRFIILIEKDRLAFQNAYALKGYNSFDELSFNITQNATKCLLTNELQEITKTRYTKIKNDNHLIPVGQQEFNIVQPNAELYRHFDVFNENGIVKFQNQRKIIHPYPNLSNVFDETTRYAHLSQAF